MSKLTLRIDELTVESFETVERREAARGTVKANQQWSEFASCGGTCQTLEGEMLCALSQCGGTCLATCAGPDCDSGDLAVCDGGSHEVSYCGDLCA